MKYTRRNRKQKGAGFMTPSQYFNPVALPPTTGFFAPVISTAPTGSEIRPIIHSTFQSGGATRRRKFKAKGGFVPSVMGGFLQNAQAAVVPAALYLVYHTMVPKRFKTSRKNKY
jgi:hypothetical protein